MDQLKNLASKASGGSSSTAQQPAAGGAQKEDYVDKGTPFLASTLSSPTYTTPSPDPRVIIPN